MCESVGPSARWWPAEAEDQGSEVWWFFGCGGRSGGIASGFGCLVVVLSDTELVR